MTRRQFISASAALPARPYAARAQPARSYKLAIVHPDRSIDLMTKEKSPNFKALFDEFIKYGCNVKRDGRAGGRAEIPLPLLLEVATGLLWALCAGPILGLVLTGAALRARTCVPASCCSPMPVVRRPRSRSRSSSAARATSE